MSPTITSGPFVVAGGVQVCALALFSAQHTALTAQTVVTRERHLLMHASLKWQLLTGSGSPQTDETISREDGNPSRVRLTTALNDNSASENSKREMRARRILSRRGC